MTWSLVLGLAPKGWNSHRPDARNLTLETHPKKLWFYKVYFSWHYYRGQRRLTVNPEKREFSGKKQSICGPLVFPIIRIV